MYLLRKLLLQAEFIFEFGFFLKYKISNALHNDVYSNNVWTFVYYLTFTDQFLLL